MSDRLHTPIAKPDKGRKNFIAPIKCRCGQKGLATWETDDWPEGLKPALLGVSSGFYVRVRKKDITASEMACAACGAVVRG